MYSTSVGVFYNNQDKSLLQKRNRSSASFSEPEPKKVGRTRFPKFSWSKFFLPCPLKKIVLSIDNILFIQQNTDSRNLGVMIEEWVSRKISAEECFNLQITAINNIVFKDVFEDKLYHILNDPNVVDRCDSIVLTSLIKKQIKCPVDAYGEYSDQCPNTLTYRMFLEKYNTLKRAAENGSFIE